MADKPAFDESKPFDKVGTTVKPPFNPSLPFEKFGSETTPGDSAPEKQYAPGLMGGISKMVDNSVPVMAAKGLGKEATWLGDKYERYLTAPTRAAHGAIQEGKGVLGAIGAGMEQFGQDPGLAPTGEQLAANSSLHLSQEPFAKPFGYEISPAKIGGAVINAVDDPLVLAGPVAKLASKGVGLVGRGALAAADVAAKSTDALTGTGVATGTLDKLTRGSVFAKESLANTNAAVRKIFSPHQAADFPEMATIAQKNGIDPSLLPESVEFGRGSFLDTAASARREGPLGEAYMERFNEANQKIQGAVEKKVSQVSGGVSPLSQPAAGVELRRGFDKSVDDFFKTIEITHDNVVSKYAPGLYVDGEAMGTLQSKLSGIEKQAKGINIRTLDQHQADEMLRAVDAVRSTNGSYKQMLQAQRSIGRAAFETKPIQGVMPSDTKALRDLYFAIDDALIGTVEKHVSPEMAAELKANNGAIHDMFEKQNQVGHVLSDKNIAPEEAFKRIVLNGDTDQIATLQKMLPPETLQQMKGAFIESLIKRNADGSFSVPQLYSAMRNKQNQIKMLFSPQETLEIGELLRLGDRMGKPVLSTSRTGSSNVFHHIADSLKSGVSNDTLIESLKDKARASAQQAPGVSPFFGKSPLFIGSKGAQMLLPAPAGRGPSSDNAMQRRLQIGQ